MLAPADVIVLNSDCEVAEGWYEGLRRAAYSDTRVATVSTLTNHGTILSVPERNRPLASCRRNGRSTRRHGACRRRVRGSIPPCRPPWGTVSI